MADFAGFSERALDFYVEIAGDNTKEFWTRHKAVYESEVRDPMRALLAELEPEFGSGTLFRPYRDIRFSRDKSPYKTHQGAFVGVSPGVGYYVELNAEGLLAGGGFHAHSPDHVARYREAVDDEARGDELAAIVTTLREDDFDIEGDRVKTQPRGYGANHPRIDLLRHKEIMAVRTLGDPPWLSRPEAADHVRQVWRQLVPLTRWVDANVAAE